MLRLIVIVKKVGDALPKRPLDCLLEDRDKVTLEFEYIQEKKSNPLDKLEEIEGSSHA